MTLKHPKGPAPKTGDISVPPLFTLDAATIPRHELPPGELPPDVAYQMIHDELMLDGNARLNVATFVTTWMEPQAEKLMAECFDKNMIDKDEYPETAEIEMRCVNILANLWNAPDAAEATGCSTTGLERGGDARRARAQAPLGQHARRAAGKPADRPNLVMGINVQVCWEKFANYWDVEMRLVPMEGDRFHLSAEEAVKLCDENTIGVVAILGSTFDGSYEPRLNELHKVEGGPAAAPGGTRCRPNSQLEGQGLQGGRLPRRAGRHRAPLRLYRAGRGADAVASSMSAPMSARAPWSIPGRRSAPARRSARTCHISGGVGIGGVLEPLQAAPDHHRGQLLHRRPRRSGRGRDRRRRLGAVDGRLLGASTKIVDRATGEMFMGQRAALFGGGVGLAARQAAAQRRARPVALLRRHRQARRREDPRQDLDQRAVARLSARPMIPPS